MEIQRKDKVADLPSEWDKLAGNYFLSTPFLLHCEKFNPCHQRYYVCFDDNKMIAGAVVYTLKLDILTFTRLKSPVKMNIVGVPASVSSQGIFGEKDELPTLKDHICKSEKGLTLLLNLDEEPLKGKKAKGRTLPTILFRNEFSHPEQYMASLRAPYRRRINQILSKAGRLQLFKLTCREFNEEMYKLYLQVFNRSKDKLEKLSLDFFRNLPSYFLLTVCYQNQQLLGWNISITHNNTCYFFMGGIDYEQNQKNDTYFLLLLDLVLTGIENKVSRIDLGQTAEIPKMRLGGTISERYMEAHHSNLLLNGLLKIFSPVMGYSKKPENATVFKQD
jgi:hypothetical protein